MNPMLVLVGLIRYSPRYFATCVLFACVMFVVVPVPLGLTTRQFFEGLEAGSPSSSWGALVLLVLLQIVEVATDPVLGNPWNSLQQKGQVLLQRNLFGAILRNYGRHGLLLSIGEAISRFRDDPRGIADGLDALCDLIGRSIFAAVAAFVMWRINAGMTLVLLAPLLLSTWLSEALATRTMAYRAAAQTATSRVTGFLGELLAGQQALIVGSATSHAVARLSALGEARRRMAVRDSVFDVLLDSFSVNMGHIGTGLILLLGAHAIADGAFGIGDFALFVVYLEQLIWYPAEIARLISDLKRIQVSFGRMHTLLPSDPPQCLVARTPLTRASAKDGPALEELTVNGLTYSHPDGSRGITDMSFTVRRGTLTIVTGPVGGGKTTLLHVLLGLLERQGGEVRWNGRLVLNPATFFLPPRSAYTPQVPRLFSQSLRENVLLGRKAAEPDMNAAIHAAVLECDVADLTEGLETPVGPRGVKLSGGQLQRAALARMFLSGADLLLMDDVSSALDARTEAELWARLLSRKPRVTCLVVSHLAWLIERADQVLRIENGRLRSYNMATPRD